MLRIGIDASNLDAGGSNTHLVEVLRAARPELHGVTRVVVWTTATTAARIDPRPWLDVVAVPMLDRNRAYRLAWQRELTRLARASCDVLFLPGQLYLGSFRPTVAMSRNLLPFEPNERKRWGVSAAAARLALLEKLQGHTFKRADGMIFLTETASRVVQARTGKLKGRTTVIPHGISPVFLREPRPQEPLSAFSAERPFRWIYVSAIDLYKHQEQVALAIAALKDEGLPVAVDFIGGPQSNVAMKQLEATLARVDPRREFVQLHGLVPYAALPERFAAASGGVFASSCENMPNSLVESMAAGLPIASSDRGVMPEVLGDAGLYFDPENAASIATSLRELLHDVPLREVLARRAYDRARLLSWQRCADDTFAFIADVARGAKG
jgi:glycosyltransferase involved in cell wall biosynthesis